MIATMPTTALPQTATGAAAVVPLQNRTEQQLADGLTVSAFAGAPPMYTHKQPPAITPSWDSLAAARLIQDAAEFVAAKSGVKPSLTNVYLGDPDPARRTWAGYAWFDDPLAKGDAYRGAFALSKPTTDSLMEGIHRLRTTPFEQWTAGQKSSFVGAQGTILHELAHITLPAYDEKTMRSLNYRDRDNHVLEEGLTELSSVQQLPEFFQREFGTAIPAGVLDQAKSMSVYRRWTTGISRLMHMAGIPDDQQGTVAARMGDAMYPGSRAGMLAKAIVAQHGGDPEGSNGRFTRVVRGSITGYIHELAGSGGKIQLTTDALDDLKNGLPVDRAAYEREIAERQKTVAAARKARPDDFGKNDAAPKSDLITK